MTDFQLERWVHFPAQALERLRVEQKCVTWASATIRQSLRVQTSEGHSTDPRAAIPTKLSDFCHVACQTASLLPPYPHIWNNPDNTPADPFPLTALLPPLTLPQGGCGGGVCGTANFEKHCLRESQLHTECLVKSRAENHLAQTLDASSKRQSLYRLFCFQPFQDLVLVSQTWFTVVCGD